MVCLLSFVHSTLRLPPHRRVCFTIYYHYYWYICPNNPFFFMTPPMQLFQDRQAAFQLLATMYIKYIQIMRRLEQCYDQIVQPQKRRVLRHCLDGVMGRILELKNEMIDLEFSEYHYFDDVLSDLKLTPVSDQSPNTVTL